MKKDSIGFPIIPWYKLLWYRVRQIIRGNCKKRCWGSPCFRSRWPHVSHEGIYGLRWRFGKVIGAGRLDHLIRARRSDKVNDVVEEISWDEVSPALTDEGIEK